MNEIIKITEHEGRKAVNARELHYFLESKQDFSTWIKGRIKKYELIENEDYVLFDKIVEQVSGGKYLIEYALTLDAAKELSMVEGNAKGKQARKYFIECEKELKSSIRILTPAEQLLESVKLTIAHEKQIAELKQRQETVENKLAGILELQAANENELRMLPLSTDNVPEMSVKDKVRMMVNKYAAKLYLPQQQIWDELYNALYYKYKVSIRAHNKIKNSESWLDVAVRTGHIDKLHTIISGMVKAKGLVTV